VVYGSFLKAIDSLLNEESIKDVFDFCCRERDNYRFVVNYIKMQEKYLAKYQ